jgi:Mob1/phocein family
MAAGPPLIPLNEVSQHTFELPSRRLTLSQLDSAFQLQEHLKALHYHYSKPADGENTVPITRETAILIATQPEGVDRALWLYELCRFLINKCNDIIIGFLFDDPPCSATTCPEMRASEWQFLCAVHESPKSCCAIDYCCHTLDWATNIVTSQKIFPSRLSLGAGDAVDERGAGVKHLTNIFRRLHRIFAHAWFQHRGVFWQVEGQTGLYVLFKTVCDTYDLLPAENYKLPPEAEGLEPIEEQRAPVPSILKSAPAAGNSLSVEEDFISVGRTNTRRHIRQSPSVGSAVTTVLESDEEEADVTQKLEELQISEEEGEAEVPVIVETYEVEEDHEATGDLLESEPVGQSETSPDSVETATSTSSWDRMSSESLEDKQEASEHEETKVEQLLDPVIEGDDAKTPFAKTQESFHDGPSILIEDEDEEQEPDAS